MNYIQLAGLKYSDLIQSISKKFYWTHCGTLTGTTIQAYSGSGSNCNEENTSRFLKLPKCILNTLCRFYVRTLLWGGGLIPLQKSSSTC